MKPALALVVALAWVPPGASAQQAPPACAAAGEVSARHLYGLWQLSLWPEDGSEQAASSRGAVLFTRHPEYPGSVRGELRRLVDGQEVSALVSGDISEGVFNLDESADGQSMSAVWVGEPDACGRSIRGTRRPAEGQPTSEPVLRFELIKGSGWQ